MLYEVFLKVFVNLTVIANNVLLNVSLFCYDAILSFQYQNNRFASVNWMCTITWLAYCPEYDPMVV